MSSSSLFKKTIRGPLAGTIFAICFPKSTHVKQWFHFILVYSGLNPCKGDRSSEEGDSKFSLIGIQSHPFHMIPSICLCKASNFRVFGGNSFVYSIASRSPPGRASCRCVVLPVVVFVVVVLFRTQLQTLLHFVMVLNYGQSSKTLLLLLGGPFCSSVRHLGVIF